MSTRPTLRLTHYPLDCRDDFERQNKNAESVLKDAETFIRKLSGGRKAPKLKDNPKTPEDEFQRGAGTGSASQMSYDNRIGNFESYIEILKNVSSYKPNEADLKVLALTAFATSLTA
jgi:hypothetical protein